MIVGIEHTHTFDENDKDGPTRFQCDFDFDMSTGELRDFEAMAFDVATFTKVEDGEDARITSVKAFELMQSFDRYQFERLVGVRTFDELTAEAWEDVLESYRETTGLDLSID